MTEYLGGVIIPEIISSGTFPVTSDYGFTRAHQPQVVVHRFGAGNAKREQRFYLGTGAKRFTVRKAAMNEADRVLLREFWENKYGPYGAFTYNAPNLGDTSNMITNGVFDSEDGWTLTGAGVAIGSGKLNFTSSTWEKAEQSAGIVAGRTYTLTYTVSGRSGGTVMAVIPDGGSNLDLTVRNADGTYTQTFTANTGSTGALFFWSAGSATLSVDNVSLFDVTATIPYLCRFANEPLSWEFLSDQISTVGVTLIEIPPPIFQDEFDRADTSDGQLGTAPSGEVWDLRGSYVASYPLPPATKGKIASGNYVTTEGVTVYASQALSVSPNRIGARVNWTTGNGGAQHGTLAMIISSDSLLINDMLHFRADPNNWNLQIRIAGGAFVDLASGAFSPTLSIDGTSYLFDMSVSGNTVMLQLAGQQTISVTDSRVAARLGRWVVWEHSYNNAPTYQNYLRIESVWCEESSAIYAVNSTVTRFPSSGLQTALLSQVQEIIPLLKIQPRKSGYAAIYISDRRCTVGGQLYQPRLLEFEGISQSIGNESDQAQFTFGNADRVMRDLVNDVDLNRASLEFSLFHVGSGIKLDLWKGEVTDWAFDQGNQFSITASDGIYELNLPYPCRKISRSCWKKYNDGNGCPYTAQGSLDLTHFPNASAASCDRSYEGDNGCLAHSMKRYFGGIIAEPQGVRIKDNSTGTWGFGRSSITSTSIVADSIYDQVVPEIYTDNESFVDKDGNTQDGMPVGAKVAAGREEGDFYEALGIIGEGPLTLHTDYGKYSLDDQKNHGYPGAGGLRLVNGADPAGTTDFLSLDSVGNSVGSDFRKVYSGNSTYKGNFGAGTAFAVIRRGDEKGIQLSYPTDHKMVANVLCGLQGWIWTGVGSRTWGVLTNPIWIAINMMLRARGLRYASAATAEAYFDVTSAVAAAAICNTTVNKMYGTGTETQFKFRGIIQEEKPLRDWIQEILMNCLGYYSFAFGKLKLGIRCNSSVVEAFTEGNILLNSLRLSPLRPAFNHLTAAFADREYDFAANSVTVYDADHSQLIGGAAAPLFLKSTMNLSGTCTKSQAARIVSTRLREELGGIIEDQWKASRNVSISTTVLALNVEPGMVCSMTHVDMPDGYLNGSPESNYGEFRVTGWRLNKDYSIDIEGRTTVDEMYDMTVGPKPADVLADAIPGEDLEDKDTGNPTGAANLDAIVSAEDETIPRYHAAFQLDAETANNNNMLGLCVYLHETATGEGPFAAERAAHSSIVIETGTCWVTAGKKWVVCPSRSSSAAVVGRLFLIYTNDGSPDSDLDGQIINAQGSEYVLLGAPFVKSGIYTYAVIKRFWEIGTDGDSGNAFYKWFPLSEIGSGKQGVWRTPPVELPRGTYYITAFTRNRHGLGTRLTAGPITITWGGEVTDDTDNPSGCSGLVILVFNDDPSIAETDMAFQFNRDLLNYQSIFAVEVALRTFTKWAVSTPRLIGDVICNTLGTMTFRCTQDGTSHATTEPTWSTGMGSETTDGTAKWRRIIPPAAHGPYALQRATWPADVLASGSGVNSTAGEVTVTLNMPTPPADNTYQDKVLLLFSSALVTAKWEPNTAYVAGDKIVDTNNKIQQCSIAGTSGVFEPTWATGLDEETEDNTVTWANKAGADIGLDGNLITSQIGNVVTVYSTERFVRTAVVNWAIVEQWWNAGQWEHTFKVPEDIKGGKLADKVWRTTGVSKIPEMVVAADVWTRNVFGVSQ